MHLNITCFVYVVLLAYMFLGMILYGRFFPEEYCLSHSSFLVAFSFLHRLEALKSFFCSLWHVCCCPSSTQSLYIVNFALLSAKCCIPILS